MQNAIFAFGYVHRWVKKIPEAPAKIRNNIPTLRQLTGSVPSGKKKSARIKECGIKKGGIN